MEGHPMTFGRPTLAQRQEQRAREKTANLRALATIPAHKLHRGSYEGASGQQAPKDKPVRSEAYRRLVAALPCAICGIEGYGQAAHPNFGKGMAMKASDVLCFCLCGPRPGEAGCHARFDQSGYMTKDERRAFEKLAATLTQKLIVSRGLWPAKLPRIIEGAST
jgi:hypothetical protein